MAELFSKDKRTISEHIQNIFKEGELAEKAVVRNFRTTAADGKKYETFHYNLDAIISVGYHFKSQRKDLEDQGHKPHNTFLIPQSATNFPYIININRQSFSFRSKEKL